MVSAFLDALLPYKAQVKYQNFMNRYGSIILLLVVAVIWFGGISILIGGAQTLMAGWAEAVVRAILV